MYYLSKCLYSKSNLNYMPSNFFFLIFFVTGAVKVECGSQFSVALTRSGSVFTWGKGDYHRLGHGNDDHVRRPKKVAALQVRRVFAIFNF